MIMAISLNTLKPAKGANRKSKRVGRGIGSGHGKTATRGYKGQMSRSGTRVRPGFEGGQMPLYRRLPKRGFCNIFRTEYAVINLKQLNTYEDGSIVDMQSLMEHGIIKKALDGLKVLADGVLERKLTVKAHRFSEAAKEKITAAGGTAEEI